MSAQSIDDHKVTVTFFKNHAASTKTVENLTLWALGDKIQHMTKGSKARLPWLKLAAFGEERSSGGALRSNANLTEITGVEVDYDGNGCLTFDQAVERLWDAGLRALVYTSASYQKGVKEKWRVLCPTSVALPPDARYGLAAVLHGLLGGGIDGDASFTLSTAFYYGSVNSNPEHRVEVLDGDFIDLRADLVAGAVGKPPKVKREATDQTQSSDPNQSPGYSEAELDAMLDRTQYKNSDGSGNWWENMRDVIASYVGRYWGDAAILAKVMPFAYEDVNVLKFLAGARERFGIPDPDIPAGAKLGDALGAIARDKPQVQAPDWRERYVETGNPKPTFHNARAAIEALSIQCSADVFHGKLYMGRGEDTGTPLLPFHGEVTDVALGALRVCLSDAFGLDFTEKHIRDAVVTLCNENQFNPVVDMLAEAEANWDKVKRLDRMAVDHFNAADTELNRACVRKTMIAAVARARDPGCKFDTITVLEAPEGWNKSSAWAVLAGEGNFSDESILGKAGREVQEQLSGIWIHENAELAGITKAEVEVIKAFASRQVDRARPAYGHFLVAQPRHSIEVGTTNANAYLLSPTGNRRFWPIEVRSEIDLQKLRAARLQLWGEAAHYQTQGEALTLPRSLWADAGVEQEARRVVHPWEHKLAEMTVVVKVEGQEYWGNGVVHLVGGEERVATSAIFEHVLKVPAGQLNNGHSKTAAAIMKMQGWLPYVFELDGKTVRGYRRTKLS
jgi:hypothetical protein